MSIQPTPAMSVTDWADSIILTINDVYNFGRLDDPDQWQSWAVKFCAAPRYSQRNIPDPYQFADWRTWAMRVYPYLEPVTEVA